MSFFCSRCCGDRSTGPVVMKALDRAGADAPAIESALAQSVANETRTAAGVLPSFDESLAHLLREAWSLSFDEYGDAAVSPVRFFETVARRGDAWPRLVAALPTFDRIDLASLASAARPGGESAVSSGKPSTDEQYPELSRYGYDMIAAARAGQFDPVIGFEAQMQAISSILLRRRQNSVTIVGDAGVGKSACAYGFVAALAEGSDRVATALHGTPVWSLDISALRAGAVVRGAIEERLQAIVKEVEQAGMILVMDDMHLLFGDQSQAGDALRSVLTDGSVRVLGTCGWREWRRHIEPDPGLARRIAPVRIAEPDDALSLSIVEGLAPVLAEHHGIEFGDNVLESSVALSRRYIVGRQAPGQSHRRARLGVCPSAHGGWRRTGSRRSCTCRGSRRRRGGVRSHRGADWRHVVRREPDGKPVGRGARRACRWPGRRAGALCGASTCVSRRLCPIVVDRSGR